MNSSISNFRIRRAITGLTLFLFFLLLSDRLSFFLISTIESKCFRDQDFKNEFLEYMRDKKFTALILGTSRTYEAIHPPYFSEILNQNAFKEAHFGKGPKYNYYFYQFYKKHQEIPKFLIYGVDYFIFNLESRKKWLYRFDIQIKKKKNYFFNFLMLLRYKKSIGEFIDYILENLEQRLHKYFNKTPFQNINKTQDYLGKNLKKKNIISKKPTRFKHFRYKRYPGNEGLYFYKLLNECEKDNVKVLLVILPDYFGTYESNIQKKFFVQNIQDISKKFKNIHIYDYNTLEKFPLKNTNYFLNGGYGLTNSHLSKAGAKYFNHILLEDFRHHHQEYHD